MSRFCSVCPVAPVPYITGTCLARAATVACPHRRWLAGASVGAASVPLKPASCEGRRESVLGSWVKQCGARVGIRKGGEGAVRLPKVLVVRGGGRRDPPDARSTEPGSRQCRRSARAQSCSRPTWRCSLRAEATGGWHEDGARVMRAGAERRTRRAGPSSTIRVPLFAARTRNATGQSRVTLSLW